MHILGDKMDTTKENIEKLVKELPDSRFYYCSKCNFNTYSRDDLRKNKTCPRCGTRVFTSEKGSVKVYKNEYWQTVSISGIIGTKPH
jgi:DNA-directed RNA polymerase subunit RPC12/RpoP